MMNPGRCQVGKAPQNDHDASEGIEQRIDLAEVVGEEPGGVDDAHVDDAADDEPERQVAAGGHFVRAKRSSFNTLPFPCRFSAVPILYK